MLSAEKGKEKSGGWTALNFSFSKDEISRYIDNIGHFGLFAVLSLLLMRVNPSRPVRLQVLDLFMLACVTELVQLYADGRTPEVIDVVIDMAGAGTAFFANAIKAKNAVKS